LDELFKLLLSLGLSWPPYSKAVVIYFSPLEIEHRGKDKKPMLH